MSRKNCPWLLVAVFSIVTFWTSAKGAEIRVVASPSVSGVLKELAPRFEAETGNKLNVSYGLVVEQKRQIETGNFDVAITPSEVTDAEIKLAKIDSTTAANFARTGLGVGVKAGAPKPDLSSAEAFKATLIAAKSFSFTANEPSGKTIIKGFDALGIGEALKQKIKSQVSIGAVWKAVATGDAELGFGFTANIVSAPGVELAGVFPADLQVYTDISVGRSATTPIVPEAEAFMRYLLAADANDALKRHGFERQGR